MNHQLNIVQSTDLELARDEVHIWSAALDRPTVEFFNWLSPDEIQNAERFHFEKDRKQFIVRHGILRKILSGYLGIEPGRIRFYYGKNDKPAIANGLDKDKLCFNLSHSEGLAVYAFTMNCEIGVDIEYMREVPEMERLTERFFSLRENEVFQMLPESGKRQAFFNCWTRKEAFVKATGDGLSYPLDKFDVSLVPGGPARLISIEGDAGAAARWSICDLKPVDGYAAALAAEGYCGKISYFQWSR